MPNLKTLLAEGITPDESTRPGDGVCGCGAAIAPRWIWRRWIVGAVCHDCSSRADEERRALEASFGIAERVAAMNLGKRARRMTFDAFVPGTDSQHDAMALVCDGLSSVWLHGKPGCGKTHLATAAAIEAAKGDMRVARWLVADLMARLRTEAMGDGMEATVSWLGSCDLLVLDDLGVDRPTPLATESLYRIVDRRYEDDLRTIVTSNAPPSVVAKTIGARVHSRLVGMCKVVKMDGPDARLA
jgi:DNA replication protein DnaC